MSKVASTGAPPGGCAKHKRRCRGKTASGYRCKRLALQDSHFCHHHDPARADAVREAGRKGGSVPRRPQLPESDPLTPEGARRLLAAVLDGLLNGTIGEGVARSVGYLLSTDARLRETSELAERIEKLEEVRDEIERENSRA